MKRNSPVLIVFITVFIDLLGFGILIPLMPYVALKYNATALQIGWLLSIYSIMQFLLTPIWGRLSDYVGRRPVILISLVGSSLGYLFFAFATSLTMLFLARMLAGIAAANISTAQAVIADVMPPEKRTAGMGIVGAAIGLGFVFGPALGALLTSSPLSAPDISMQMYILYGPELQSLLAVRQVNYTLPFLIAAGLSAFDLILAYFILPETLNRKTIPAGHRRKHPIMALGEAMRIPAVPVLLLISLLYFISFAAMESTFALFGLKLFSMTPRQNGLILFGVGLIMTLVQGGIVGRVSRIIGDGNVLLLGIIGVLLGLFLIGYAPTFRFFILSCAVLAVSAGLVTPAMTSLISQFSPADTQGGMLGLNQSMASLGRILGPLIGTGAFYYYSPRSPFYLGAILIFIACLSVLLLRPSLKHPESTRESV